jgi:hypothetical protein
MCIFFEDTKVEPINQNQSIPPHPANITNGTADRDYWKIYGLGLRTGAMKRFNISSCIFWIDSFPEDKAPI